MHKIIYVLACLLVTASHGQFNLLNASSPDEVGKKTEKQQELDYNEPLVYPYVDDKDILWSKVVYEYIDGYEQFNYPLFFPTQDSQFSEDRKSLWRILREYLYESEDSITVYDANFRNFNVKFTYNLREPKPSDVIGDQFYLVNTKLPGDETDYNLDGVVDENDVEYLPSENIVGYNLKGVWYFDKKYGELRYRLIGIQPVGYTAFDLGAAQIAAESDGNALKPVAFFWLWYKDIREVLHKHYVFSDRNNSKRITFDQLLLSRKFHTYLYRIDNVMNDRDLLNTPYINDDPYLRITESQRLKEIIRNFEHDTWSN